jgi:UDP-glucose 4-epimerase
MDGTLNLLVAARDAKVKRVIYAASSSAYGDTPTLPKREDMPPNPISPYPAAKLAGEYYMTSFYRCYGLETVSLRYFNVFGPRQDPVSPYSGVLAKFITQMLKGEPVNNLWGWKTEPGLQLRRQCGRSQPACLPCRHK